MKKVEERAAAIGRAAQQRKIARLTQAAAEAGIRAEAQSDAIILTGKDLVRRWLNEASLRFITGLMR